MLLLVILIAVIVYLVLQLPGNTFRTKVRQRKKRYPRQRETMVKRMPTAILAVYFKTGIKEYPITDRRDGFYIGSGDQCDLKIPKSESEYIDIEHALISYDEYANQYTLVDLNSLNGIYDASQQRLDQLTLAYGMQFRVADILMEYRQYNVFDKGV